MSYRFMRMIVFFDLPTETEKDKKAYRNFRKLLIKNGFIMMQESVYTKLMITPTVELSITTLIKKNKPEKGIVQILTITEKQFSKMECIVGSYKNDILDTDERLVVL